MKVVITYRKLTVPLIGEFVATNAVTALGGVVTYASLGAPVIFADVPDAALAQLRADPSIEKIEREAPGPSVCRIAPSVTVIDDGVAQVETMPLATAPWGVARVRAPELHSEGITGQGITIAILDTGGDFTHRELAPSYLGGWNYITNTATPHNDVHSHGTHCWGIVAAAKDGQDIFGTAPGVKVFVGKVLSDAGSGQWPHIAAAVEDCVKRGIQIASLSLGGNADPGTGIGAIFQAAADAGLLIFAAAGNRGVAGTGGDVDWPARYPSCIAVAATDDKDAVASFSSRGPKVEVAAPGAAVNSTIPGGLFGIKSGTSMATPHAAAIAALALSNGVPKAELRARLQAACKDFGAPGRDVEFGHGFLDAYALAKGEAPPPPPPPPPPPQSGPTVVVKAVYTDPDGDQCTVAWQAQPDGLQGTGNEFTFEFGTSLGMKTIEYVVTDPSGLNATLSRQVEVIDAPNQPPVSVLRTEGELVGPAPRLITFDATASFDPPPSSGLTHVWYLNRQVWDIPRVPRFTGSFSAGNNHDFIVGHKCVDAQGLESQVSEVTVSIRVPNRAPLATALQINGT